MKVKLFIGMISNKEDLFEKVTKKLIDIFGGVDYKSKVMPWDFTAYYEDELGKNLKRKFIFFKNFISADNISLIKLKTIEIEKEFSVDNKRRINLDPGYLDLNKVVLVSTKDAKHRIYLDNGIFAEVTLSYENKSFTANRHTYPDFRSQSYIKLFNLTREKFIRHRHNPA